MAQSAIPVVPRTAAELAELEARYQPFLGAEAWAACHVDEPRWTRYRRALERRVAAAGEGAWHDAQARLIRAAALDSTALDGLFPPNPDLTTMVLSSAIGGQRADDAAIDLVAECHRRALILASEAAAAGQAVDTHLIAVLQDVITESQASYAVSTDEGVSVEVDLPRRQYKPVSNYLLLPSGDLTAFAPAAAVPTEMERLAAELAAPAFAALHPVVQAAYAHYALTAIHPFADGNGRLARTIASVYLFRAVGLPLLIFADQWPAYYQALQSATADLDLQSMADLLCAAAMTAMDLAGNLAASPDPGSLLASAPGVMPTQAQADAASDDAARGLLDALSIELRDALIAPPGGIGLGLSPTRSMPADHVESAYRMVGRDGKSGIRVAVRVPGGADRSAADLEFVALVSEIPGDLLPIALRETRTGEWLEVAFADAYPLVLEPTALRIGVWARRLLAEAIAPLVG